MENSKKARVIPFYLPQFHPVPENDKWWGKGFTEWTNVAKARPLFKDHLQPKVPTDLGFYDLRVPETRIAQAELAREHGIEGFCYWHYWFSGKRLLERPFNEVLQSKEPDFPFCIGWANQTWTGIWHGAPDRILQKQEYPGKKDYENHFYALLDAFTDDRYITVDGMPIIIIFSPLEIPDSKQFIEIWQNLAVKEGLKGFHFIAIADHNWDREAYGFDSYCVDYFTVVRTNIDNLHRTFWGRISKSLFKKDINEIYRRVFRRPATYSYRDIIKYAFHSDKYTQKQYPCIYSNWDNTPRSKHNGVVFQNSTPELFRAHLKDAIKLVDKRPRDKRFVFIKSWNEWAEGNYLEPDQEFGNAYLKVIKEEVMNQ